MDNLSLFDKVQQSVSYLKETIDFHTDIGIILGTGLGELASNIKPLKIIDYSEIPYFPLSTVESHQGKLIFGELSGKKVIAMQGRFHYYEGYSMQQITFPVRVMKYLGIDKLIITNACGSLNPYIPITSIVVIDDHINLIGDNPLIGPHDDRFGPRFVDMSEPYSKELIKIAEDTALSLGIKLHKGVYAAMSGPSLETRAEYRFLRTIGADLIGMSTIPECIVARQMGIKVLGFSIVTDECYPDALKPVSVEEIIKAAGIAEPNLTKLVMKIIEKLN
jgi:purine-nucleoside phosphorylase